MDGKRDSQPEMSLTLKYLLENPALLQPPDSGEEGRKSKFEVVAKISLCFACRLWIIKHVIELAAVTLFSTACKS